MKKDKDHQLLWESYRDEVNHKFPGENKQAAKDQAEVPSRAVGNKEPPIDFNENPAQGYLNIFQEDEEYHIELRVGVQSFKLAYSNEDYESAVWMAKQFAHALNRAVGDVRLYGKNGEDEG